MTDQALILDSLFEGQKSVCTSLALEINILEDMNAQRGGIIENLQSDLKSARRKIKVQRLFKWGGLIGGVALGFFVPRALNL